VLAFFKNTDRHWRIFFMARCLSAFFLKKIQHFFQGSFEMKKLLHPVGNTAKGFSFLMLSSLCSYLAAQAKKILVLSQDLNGTK
jgi:hypothetical protein